MIKIGVINRVLSLEHTVVVSHGWQLGTNTLLYHILSSEEHPEKMR